MSSSGNLGERLLGRVATQISGNGSATLSVRWRTLRSLQIRDARVSSGGVTSPTWFGRKAEHNDDKRPKGWQNPGEGSRFRLRTVQAIQGDRNGNVCQSENSCRRMRHAWDGCRRRACGRLRQGQQGLCRLARGLPGKRGVAWARLVAARQRQIRYRRHQDRPQPAWRLQGHARAVPRASRTGVLRQQGQGLHEVAGRPA